MFLSNQERDTLSKISDLAHANPFLPERFATEKTLLGRSYVDSERVWHAHAGYRGSINVKKIDSLVEDLAATLQKRLLDGVHAQDSDLTLYEDLILYLLYNRYHRELLHLTEGVKTAYLKKLYQRFSEDVNKLLVHRGAPMYSTEKTAHLFAVCFQFIRAFRTIFDSIIGGSMPVARLRGQVWESIFTRDRRRYRRSLYQRMGDITTMVTGPSGTGKELVARAIAQARYVPFHPEKLFPDGFDNSYFTLNLSALSPTLLESELFGHKRGAFTGALLDRPGWFEVCPEFGTVFLDEIGEVDTEIQVKLLRVLQVRTFQRLGETEDRAFNGKVVAATNRDLAVEMETGRFREDFYYRMCSDIIRTPSLQEQLSDTPEELVDLAAHIARKVAGEEEADALAQEAYQWIDTHLGLDYPWPGNVRELEQCVRNIMIRGDYRPPKSKTPNAAASLAAELARGALSADEILRRYCTMDYAKTGSYLETARRLDMDRRTIKSKIDPDLLEKLKQP